MEQWLNDHPEGWGSVEADEIAARAFARERDAAYAELEARIAYLEPLAVDNLADQLARFADADDITALHDVATRQCWERIEQSVKKGVNPEEVWLVVRAYRAAHIAYETAALERQRDALLASLERVRAAITAARTATEAQP